MIRDRILNRLDEVSSKTLKAYIRKASHNNPDHDVHQYNKRQKKIRLAKQKLNVNGNSKIGAN
jgi:hypothetical protein